MIFFFKKKLSFFKTLEYGGLIRGNYVNGAIKKNIYLIFKSYFMLFVSFSYVLKMLSILYFKPSIVDQIKLGNFFFFEPKASFWSTIVFALCASYFFLFNLVINHLHKSSKYTNYMDILVMDVDKQINFKVKGLSEKENREFWIKHIQIITMIGYSFLFFNYFYCIIVILKFRKELKNFGFEENFFCYLSYSHLFTHGFYTPFIMFFFSSIFILACLFVSKRYNFLLNKMKKQFFFEHKMNNRKLKKMIYIFNKISSDLNKINLFFKYPQSLTLFFGLLTLITGYFFALSSLTNAKFILGLIVFSSNFFIINVPYYFANKVLVSVIKEIFIFN